MEIWKPIPGFEGSYSASNLGNIRSEDRVVKHFSGGPKRVKGKLLKPWTSKHGYLYVGLAIGESLCTKQAVHRLVLSAFDKAMPKEFDCCHKDSDRTNNHVGNLRWDTRAGNMQDAVKLGRTNKGTKNPNSKLNEDAVRLIRGDTRIHSAIAADFCVAQSVITRIKARQAWGWVI